MLQAIFIFKQKSMIKHNILRMNSTLYIIVQENDQKLFRAGQLHQLNIDEGGR